MKRFLTAAILVCISTAVFAQRPSGDACKKNNTKNEQHCGTDRMKAEKIAFITDFVGLTPEEAQAFWPIYNQIEEQQNALAKAEYSAYHELRNAQKSGEGDIASLLDKYLSAKTANVNLHAANVGQYKKILPIEKVAKLFTSEEKYRRELIGRLRNGNSNGPAVQKPGFRPEGDPSQSRPGSNRKPGPESEPQK